MGVYEAAMVFAMGLFGVGKNSALALALLLHMMMFIPTTVYGMWVFLKSGMSLKKIHDAEEQGGE
jgi:hypothetical protein